MRLFNWVKSRLRSYVKRFRTRRTNLFVKEYYHKNKHLKTDFVPNCWNKNHYWDFFYQGLPHSIKSKYFVPYDYYTLKIEPIFNNKDYSGFVLMKNMYDQVFGNMGVKMPRTIIRCMNNMYLDSKYNSISDPMLFLDEIDNDIIIKAASDSYGGYSVKKFLFIKGKLIDIKTGNAFNLTELTKLYNGSFIVQEVVIQHPEIMRFHPQSLNTIRVMSYRSIRTNEVVIPMAMLRMGVDDSIVDNASSNGVAVSVDDSGYLSKLAFNQYGDYYHTHPSTGIKFEGVRIPGYERIKQDVIRLSNLLPYQRILGWDFSIDEKGNPVLIEVNIGTGTWMYQIVTGKPLFGIYSEEVKDYLKSL